MLRLNKNKPKSPSRGVNHVGALRYQPKSGGEDTLCYDTEFTLGTEYTAKEERVRRRAERRIKNYGSDYWLLPRYQNNLEMEGCSDDSDFVPQMGTSIETAQLTLQLLAKHVELPCGDDILRELEGLTLLVTAIANASNMSGVVSAIGLYLRDKFDTSLSSEILSYVCEIVWYIP